jgi:DNA topoisomerase-1
MSKAAPKPQKPDDDSEDDHKPIGLKINSAKVVAPNNANKTVMLKSAPKPEPDDDSEDEKPLASRLPTNAASKSVASDDSEDEKPLSARFPRATAGASASISNSKDKFLSNNNSNAPRNPVKRPSDSSNQSSSALKKAKPSDTSALATVKRESNADGNVRKLTVGESSKSKPSAKGSVKKSPSSLKKNKKLKMKTKKNSQFSKSSRVPPGSGDGKKWSTLEHNGVIFPPPYSPHGVKMLYNGQPVELTPAQEEVIYLR